MPDDYIDVMDDPTYCCDYWRRCDNKVIKLFLRDLEDAKNMEEVQEVYNKWDEKYAENEKDDK